MKPYEQAVGPVATPKKHIQCGVPRTPNYTPIFCVYLYPPLGCEPRSKYSVVYPLKVRLAKKFIPKRGIVRGTPLYGTYGILGNYYWRARAQQQ